MAEDGEAGIGRPRALSAWLMMMMMMMISLVCVLWTT